MTKYIDITSGTAGESKASRRNMGARCFTTSALVGYRHEREFTSADGVLAAFGSSSREYAFASKYFGFISKSITKATKLSFARYGSDITKGYVRTAKSFGSDVVSKLQSISSGKLYIKVGSETKESPFTLNFSTKTRTNTTSVKSRSEDVPEALNVSNAATFGSKVNYTAGDYQFTYLSDLSSWVLGGETSTTEVDLGDYAIGFGEGSSYSPGDKDTFTITYTTAETRDVQSLSDAVTLINTQLTNATDTYWHACSITIDSDVITFTLGNSVDQPTNYFTPSSDLVDVATVLNLTEAAEPVLSDFMSATTPTDAVANSIASNDNFGSFMFLPRSSSSSVPDLTAAEITAVASANAARNMKYLYSVSVGSSNFSAVSTALGSISDVVVGYYDEYLGWDYEEFQPMALFAATNYSRPNSTKCNMYQQFDDANTTVETDTLSESLDLKRINYYGCTQKAGKKIAFYQRGYNHDGTDTACFCNEVWLKDAIETECLNLFLAKEKIPANETGRALVQMIIKGVVDEGLYNGAIMPGATLDNIQKSTVNTLANDEDAADAVETNGYWLGVTVNHKTDDYSNVLYYADYVLIYKKGDAIRKVTGSDVLI